MSDSRKYPKLSGLIQANKFDRIAEIIHMMRGCGFDFDRPNDTFYRLTEQDKFGLGEHEAMCEIAKAAAYGRLHVAIADSCLDDKRVYGSDVVGYVDDTLKMVAAGLTVNTYFGRASKSVVVYGYDKRIVNE